MRALIFLFCIVVIFAADSVVSTTCTVGTEGQCKAPLNHQCKDKTHCIHDTWICDGYSDCPDNSDEDGCSSLLKPTLTAKLYGGTVNLPSPSTVRAGFCLSFTCATTATQDQGASSTFTFFRNSTKVDARHPTAASSAEYIWEVALYQINNTYNFRCSYGTDKAGGMSKASDGLVFHVSDEKPEKPKLTAKLTKHSGGGTVDISSPSVVHVGSCLTFTCATPHRGPRDMYLFLVNDTGTDVDFATFNYTVAPNDAGLALNFTCAKYMTVYGYGLLSELSNGFIIHIPALKAYSGVEDLTASKAVILCAVAVIVFL